jgi:phosphoserine phosphatase
MSTPRRITERSPSLVYRADAWPLYEIEKLCHAEPVSAAPAFRAGTFGRSAVSCATNMTNPTFSEQAQQFMDSVLGLEPRFAAFDCDGTLWPGDAGEGFFSWGFEHRLVSDEVILRERARYAEYLAGKVSEDAMCGAMATLHEGLMEADVRRAAAEYFEQKIAPQIFPEMRETVRRLLDSGCDVWVVSSTSEWVIQVAMKRFGIPENRILAAAVRSDQGRITDELTRLPSGPGKAQAIREVVGKDPDAAFGNSRWDADMLAIARHPFAVNPSADLERLAGERGWPLYWPDAVRR